MGYHRGVSAEEIINWGHSYGDYFQGVILNKCHQYSSSDININLAPALDMSGIKILGALPEERVLIAPTVSQIVAHIDAQYFIYPEDYKDLIENILIGGLITEWGGNYFNRLPKQAVIVRGGRIDIQMSALNFPLNLMVLTNCEAPSQYVFQRAENLGVPLVTVATNTHQTIEALETIQSRVNIFNPHKIRHLSDVLAKRLDLNFIETG